MGRRKKRRVIRRKPRLKPSAFFRCPLCQMDTLSIKIDRNKGIAVVKCGDCGLNDTVEIYEMEEEVDAYSKIVDKYLS
ncbi:MAG TPA: hypothetical protein ENF42_00935 [Candidatus Bathyarchaeota archaeon]|nr:hypothetical protein [Candidatus Bathyarchaeota archaeon]